LLHARLHTSAYHLQTLSASTLSSNTIWSYTHTRAWKRSYHLTAQASQRSYTTGIHRQAYSNLKNHFLRLYKSSLETMTLLVEHDETM
jgi:hypothetical protein